MVTWDDIMNMFLGEDRGEPVEIAGAVDSVSDTPAVGIASVMTKPSKQPKTIELTHYSGQYKDFYASGQQEADAAKLFKMNSDIYTFTEQLEMGPMMSREAAKRGFKYRRRGEQAIMIPSSPFIRFLETGYNETHGVLKNDAGQTIGPSSGVYWAKIKWYNETIFVHTSHMATFGLAKIPRYKDQHAKDSKALAKLVKEHAGGRNLSFFTGDFNKDQSRANEKFPDELFREYGLETGWKALKVWPNTHGNRCIDYIGRYSGDARTKIVGHRVTAMHSDHRTITATYAVSTTGKLSGPADKSSADFRMGSHNIRNYPDIPDRSVREAAKIAGSMADIIGFQEISEAADKLALQQSLPDFKFVALAHRPPQGFNKEKFVLTKEGPRGFIPTTKSLAYIAPALGLTIATYKPRGSDVNPFVVINVHFTPGAFRPGIDRMQERRRDWDKNYEILIATMKKWRNAGYTVFVMGDFNRPDMPLIPVPSFRWLHKDSIDYIGVAEGNVKVKVEKTSIKRTPSDHRAIAITGELRNIDTKP